MRKTELLIPASSLEVLKVAVTYGADAVYIGGEMFGLRAKARNFSLEEMKEDLDAFINKLTDGEGVDVIFEAAGIPALLAHATSQLSPAGRLVAMTFGKEPIPVNFKEINAKELTILGTRHQYQKFPEVVKILPDHLKEVDEITTHVFKAEDFQKAFDTLADRNSGAGKVVLTFA